MRIEFVVDRAGLFWSGLGVSLHVARQRREPGEAFAWVGKDAGRGRTFRLGHLAGAVSPAR